jgi:hypothetical protein
MDGEGTGVQSETILTASITPLVLSLVTFAEVEREYVEEIQWGGICVIKPDQPSNNINYTNHFDTNCR